jgi:hypothetical protein
VDSITTLDGAPDLGLAGQKKAGIVAGLACQRFIRMRIEPLVIACADVIFLIRVKLRIGSVLLGAVTEHAVI